MPWTEILGGATGGLAAFVVAAFFVGKVVAEKVGDAATRMVDARLARAEASFEATLAAAGAVDTDLREKRIDVYAEPWRKTGLLPLYPRRTDVDYDALRGLTADLRDWYFDRGGMYLSTRAREAYFGVQKGIDAVLADGPAGVVAPEHYEAVRTACSALRTELAGDLLSRRDAPVLETAP